MGPRLAVTAALVALATGCTGTAPPVEAPATPAAGSPTSGAPELKSDSGPRGRVTLAFAGDVHFQLHLAALLDDPRGAWSPIARTLRQADVAMVNLETAVTERGTPDPKEREVPAQRFYYRTSAGAFDVLAAAGIDVAAMANNHAGDYGQVGVLDALAAARNSPVAVAGLGRDRQEAFTPYRVRVRGTELAFFSADASFREGASPVWAAGPSSPGVAAAHARRPRHLLAAVRAADSRVDVVVVYLHWGEAQARCPSAAQRVTARALARAGADVVVGSHAHVPQGSGWMGRTLVGYGLGNFVWYHNREAESGVLRVGIRDGRVVRQGWVPARIGLWGRPRPVQGSARAEAVADRERLRSCAHLASSPK